jgi:hypothetical protein
MQGLIDEMKEVESSDRKNARRGNKSDIQHSESFREHVIIGPAKILGGTSSLSPVKMCSS